MSASLALPLSATTGRPDLAVLALLLCVKLALAVAVRCHWHWQWPPGAGGFTLFRETGSSLRDLR